MAKQSAPKDLAESGAALWAAVLAEYDLEEHEVALLHQQCRIRDVCDKLAGIVATEGVMDPETGRAHPAAVELRQQSIAFARLSAALRLPSGDEEDPAQKRRPQRRVGARGVYSIRGGAA